MLEKLRKWLWELMTNSVRQSCPEFYAGGEWEDKDCDDCPWRESCPERRESDIH